MRGSSNPMQCWGSLAVPEAARGEVSSRAGSAHGGRVSRGVTLAHLLPSWRGAKGSACAGGATSEVTKARRRHRTCGRGEAPSSSAPSLCCPTGRPRRAPRAEGRDGPRADSLLGLCVATVFLPSGFHVLRLTEAPGGGTGGAPCETWCRPLNQDS